MRIHLQIAPNSVKLAHWWSINYFHFFTQKMPVIWNFLNDEKLRFNEAEVLYDGGKFRELLRTLCPVTLKPWRTGGMVRVIPPQEFSPMDSPCLRPMAAYMGRDIPATEEPGITIISRSKSRRLPDLQRIKDALKTFGLPVRVDTFAGKSIAYQIGCMKSTEVLVSPHGAELTNVLFMPPAAAVVEIFPYGFDFGCYRDLSKIMNHRHERVEGFNRPAGIDEDSAALRERVARNERIRFRLRDVPTIRVKADEVAAAVAKVMQ